MSCLTANNGSFPQQRTTRVGNDYGKDLFTFEEVKSLIEPKDRQRFQDTLLNSRKRKKVSTDTTRLVNGNAIVEEYNYTYHPEDDEMRSPISIEGETRLVAIG